MNQPAPSAAPQQASDRASIVTRFGEFAIQADRIVTFAQGMFGFDHRRAFFLADIPNASAPFKLLQSAEDPELSFIVLPLDRDQGPIEPADFEQACRTRNFNADASLALGVVTLRPLPGNTEMTMNLRAPVMIDTGRRIGCQHVFADEKYALRQPLLLDQHHGR